MKEYTLERCGKTFSQSNNLVVNKRTHSGENMYACDTCDKDFRHKMIE